MRRRFGFISLIFLAAVMAATAALAADAAKPAADHTLNVKLIGLRSSNGKVHCTLYNDPAAFPDDASKALKEAVAPVENESATCTFADLAPGKYAVVAFHDENDNGKFDENFLGLPQEGYAFSNGVKPRFSKPNFDECAFDYSGGAQKITIKMIY